MEHMLFRRDARRRPAQAAALLVMACVCSPGLGVAAAPVASRPAAAGQARTVVRVAYFIPSDREPIAGYVERIDRVLSEVQRFYREGMAAAGYGPMTFSLDRDEAARLRVHVVRGSQPAQAYGRNASGAVRGEVKRALAGAGLDIDRETLVIFQVLLSWDGGKATEIGPYCGGGSHTAGTAWVYDDERLDPRQLPSKQPGGYYNAPCSIGRFNTHYIGGVAHEMGHSFGLPHICERKADRGRGKALMGGGNHTYGQEKRGEGPGTFLSAASAMLLSRCRPFAGDLADAHRKPTCRLEELKASFADGALTLTGRVAAEPPADGVAAYNDLAAIAADYDAVGWMGKVDRDGRFRLEVGEMRPGASQLRLLICHANGARSTLAFDYEVGADGRPGLDAFSYSPVLAEAVQAYVAGDWPKAQRLAREVLQGADGNKKAGRKAAHLGKLMQPGKLLPPAAIPEARKAVPLSNLVFRGEKVGWGRPLRDQVLPEGGGCFLQVGGTFHESGLYAHAPATHVLDLGGRWKRLVGGCGLQDGHDGSVVFVVRGDGREIYRSEVIRDHALHKLDADVSGVAVLELAVEDAGDGTHSDWGVWIGPELQR